jgi:predicted adenylyl cyclase CyaB
MATNIEIKARARHFSRTLTLAQSLSQGDAVILSQEDIFYKVPRGRLKLRILAADRGELIFYQREDKVGPKQSDYQIHATSDPASLNVALAGSLGTIATVRKRRRLFMVGQTRVHLDEVEGLGQFIELEVVMRADQPAEDGMQIANRLMQQLEIEDADLVDVAYVDLLLGAKDRVAAKA